MRRVLILLAALFVALPAAAKGCDGPAEICTADAPGALQIVGGGVVPIERASTAAPGIDEAASNLDADIWSVGEGRGTNAANTRIIVGTLGQDIVIDRLVAEGRIDASPIRGKWEAFLQQVVDNPAPGIGRALIVVGSDRRGTIYGIYDLSRRIGVSPWAWWADVPVRKRKALYVMPGARVEMPGVRYRGIFLNDEDPALKGWATETFGGLNHQFYHKVFELILRLKGNYLWPAMWGKSLWDDDSESAALANRLGIVLGTSHHEPLLRAHVEWSRYGKGPWDYTQNADRLRAFWREGVKRNAGREAILTVGMRGDGDEPMTRGTATALLERIVADQRKIIANVTGKPAARTPQLWALYKEVQDYYDAGMRVPDDVTLLFSDDNWGNIRRLPEPGDTRAGGYGVYYHFDYVGGPRNYKWINTVQIARVWEQMSLAAAHRADRIWIVNVGDLKPMELPISFFLDMAWNPSAMTLARMTDYHRDWAAEQFGPEHAAAIGDVLDRTTRYLARRKPELLGPEQFADPDESKRILTEYDTLRWDAEAIARDLPADVKDAYFQLVLYPVLAATNLNELYGLVAFNHRTADSAPALADAAADAARRLFACDAELARRYEASAGGKWTHMMSQTHIGYTGWQQPDRNILPQLRYSGAPGDDATCIPVPLVAPDTPDQKPATSGAFVERDGVIAIEAEHFARRKPVNGVDWMVIPGLGRTLSAVTPWPQIAPSAEPGSGAMLEYRVRFETEGDVTVDVVASPSLDVTGKRGLRYAVSIDDAPPRLVDLWAGTTPADWAKAVSESVRVTSSAHRVTPGEHRVRLWMIDPGIVVQRLVIHRDPLPNSLTGPLESARH